ncbi:MAG: hypothetical protein CVU48_03555 [Candidatus Cloacimonetes bacterium HGW-Cloacimonetes-1]|jgi:DNA mismatch repair ATPase MutS|nr:MAG: hypothetical protein CVU48_03555 [Candidatus Cloacimonetes bacterium HGW-Cloacimonetes-1]
MQQSNIKALNLDQIYAQIVPQTDHGKSLKRKTLHTVAPTAREIKTQYQRIQLLMEGFAQQPGLRDELRDYLAHIPALISPSAERELELHDLFELKLFVHYYTKIRNLYIRSNLKSLHTLPDLHKVYEILDPDRLQMPVFQLSPVYSASLAQTLAALQQASLELRHKEHQHLVNARDNLQMPNLKAQFVISRMQGSLIEQLSQSSYFVISSENMANVTFTLSDSKAIRTLKAKIYRLRQRLKTVEAAVLAKLNLRIKKHLSRIETAISAITNIDWDFARAEFGSLHGCITPRISSKSVIRITGAINLPLQEHLDNTGRHLQALDLELSSKVNILTGPNMGGKTTALKTLGQLCQMAKHAIPLPCAAADIPLFDFIWYNLDDETDSADLSSFGRETVSLSQALKHRGRGLILLDEFGKGTNPSEGEAIATAVLRYLQTTKHQCFAATHYTAPTRLPHIVQYAITGFSEDVFTSLENTMDLKLRLQILNDAMDYRIMRLRTRQAPPLCAIKIAEVLGLSPDILKYLR